MSGSSGGGGIPSINRPNQNENCEGLIINTNLASPQPEVVSSLNQGDFLEITIASDQGPIQAFDAEGNLAGNIISREQVKLLNCIISGTEYTAEVISISGGQCKIQIRPI
ncbi:hypothetical protein [Leeuwenhoekiella palythoae]|uniref:Uncharacterized protein n=1 Tax=Leeuwenhoekiella palythoae TaxID=573501 RepID=A0A1M5ZCS5_9FLAO|nr:hypothetical protein [Leeuwenhoekiella palythoae]MAS21222.1 hypothetical protein [Leeuwenhoekiella sp.]SHI21984.1 hypothetical protein SAMN04487999_2938 [Leeuwenhoekiella palythoae]|tara:strand:- start:4981 stop:5310 length:330 start_codon:yes stop_codon:yes gene_type:complete